MAKMVNFKLRKSKSCVIIIVTYLTSQPEKCHLGRSSLIYLSPVMADRHIRLFKISRPYYLLI